ncbi:MAG: uroporphyrinogen decarboxylase family protein [Candidatus Methanoplasma sp.]|nr:uroporphyrinogen decarboxylase family protein [Candidatus Methanoplasma sp.]
MGHKERAMAALSDEKVDTLAAYPIACGVCRKLIGDGGVSYREWCGDPETYAKAFLAGQRRFGLDFAIGLMDLSVMAGDLGAHVRMDEQNTPFVDKHIVSDMEDYEKLAVPDVRKGRTGVLIEGARLLAEKLGDEVVASTFIEGPLLALSQSAGAERLFMDMFTDPAPVHKALKTMTEYDSEIVKAMSQTGIEAICWDYLWGNYSCLGDAEYGEFEGNEYAKRLNRETVEGGMAVAIHNCADLPHLDTQIKKFKPSVYSMAYYPLIEGSPSAGKVIADGYADECVVAGNLDPQLFIRGSVGDVTSATKSLCQEVKTALCKRGLNSRYCIASGCEVPPDINCKLENIDAMVEASRKYGRMDGC